MSRVLIYEPSFRRIEARLAALGGPEVLLMARDGSISLNGAPVSPEAAAPEIGWTNADLFGDAPIRAYVSALLKSPNLAWVQSGAAGFDDPLFRRIVEKGARLTTNHSQAVGISEYVLTTVLDHFQRGPERRAAQAEGRWARLAYREVAGSRWLIVGFGAIGQGVAHKARAFDAHVTGVRRSPGPHDAADAMITPDELRHGLGDADVVVLCAPLSAGTARLVDAGFLTAMKPGSVLVNVGRGGLIDEPALLAALDRGVPEHAILDVFATEPLPPDSPFWRHPRFTLTGHASALGSGLAARGDDLFLANLARYLAGEPLANAVSAEAVLAG